MRIRPRFCVIEKMLVNLVLPICLILSFVLPFFLYDNKYAWLVKKLNLILNTRIWLAEQFLRSEYRSLFGADISQVVKSSMTMDNSYVWGYINYGLVFFGILMLGYFALVFYDTHRQRTKELVILICFLGAGWTEPLLFNTSFKNVTLLFLGSLFFLQKEGTAEYCLFPGLQETVRIPFAKLPDRLAKAAGIVWKKAAGKILCAIAVGAVVGGILCRICYTVPEGYVVQRFYTDGREETSVYLEGVEDPAYEGWKVMNYVDQATPMQLVQGKAVTLETARYYVGCVLIGGFLGGMAAICYGMVRETERKR